jgi:hypothetical protein
MDFCCNFVEVFSKQGSTNFSIDFHIQFDVWIIYGIKISWKWIIILFIVFYIVYGVQILVIRNNHEYGVLMDYR